MLQQNKPARFVLQDHILDEKEKSNDFIDQENPLNLGSSHSDANNAYTIDSEDELEHMIDQVVDRHIHELRRDIRRLLVRVKQEP